MHVREAARLPAVAVDGEVLVGERLADEARHDHSVDARLPRADRVEEAGDDGVGVALTVVAEGDRLSESLRGRVGPAGDRGRAQDPVGVLGEAIGVVLAVDLRGRGEEQPAIEPVGRLRDQLRCTDAAAQCFDRTFDDQLHADRGGEVKAGVGLLHALVDESFIAHRPLDELGLAGGESRLDVGDVAGAEVVDNQHTVAPGDQGIG